MMLSVFAPLALPTNAILTDAVKTATAFIELVDDNDSEELAEILHPEMVQFAKIGDQLHPFKATDFIQMVAEKKLGGTPRQITVHSVQLVRDDTVNVVLQAVSTEYDFMYQIALAKVDDKWLVVGVMSDIKPAQ